MRFRAWTRVNLAVLALLLIAGAALAACAPGGSSAATAAPATGSSPASAPPRQTTPKGASQAMHRAADAFDAFVRAYYTSSGGRAHYTNTPGTGTAVFWRQAELIEMTEDAYQASRSPALKAADRRAHERRHLAVRPQLDAPHLERRHHVDDHRRRARLPAHRRPLVPGDGAEELRHRVRARLEPCHGRRPVVDHRRSRTRPEERHHQRDRRHRRRPAGRRTAQQVVPHQGRDAVRVAAHDALRPGHRRRLGQHLAARPGAAPSSTRPRSPTTRGRSPAPRACSTGRRTASST